jgi:hypothetical protein
MDNPEVLYEKTLIDWVEDNRYYLSKKTCFCIKVTEKDRFQWDQLSYNTNAIEWISTPKYSQYINWEILSSNKKAISLLEKNIDKLYWYGLSANPNAISLLEQNMDKIHWSMLSRNKNAIHLLEINPDKIDWYNLCLSDPFIRKK